jgi:hypothetical protein
MDALVAIPARINAYRIATAKSIVPVVTVETVRPASIGSAAAIIEQPYSPLTVYLDAKAHTRNNALAAYRKHAVAANTSFELPNLINTYI